MTIISIIPPPYGYHFSQNFRYGRFCVYGLTLPSLRLLVLTLRSSVWYNSPTGNGLAGNGSTGGPAGGGSMGGGPVDTIVLEAMPFYGSEC